MATNTAGGVSQVYQTNQTHYLHATVTYADDGTAVSLGYIPAGACVLRAYAIVTTLFNDTGNDYIDIGYPDDGDEFAADLDVSAVGMKEDTTTMASAGNLKFTSITEITAQYDGANGNSSAGSAEVFVEYALDRAG